MQDGLGNNGWHNIIYDIAARGIKNQEVHEGDYYDDEGFLHCGKCKMPRQMMKTFEDGKFEEPLKPFKITVECRCDIARKEAEEREKANKENMQKIQNLRKISLMDEKFSTARFGYFEKNQYNERNLRLCNRYASKFTDMEAKSQGLLLWGNVGTGKSFAAACIANDLLDRMVSVVMTSFVKILEVIQSGEEQETNLMRKLENARLVIFDDLGAERNTDYALEKVYNVIDSRYRSGKPMILTTNLTIEEMKNESDIRYSRIYDRIFEVCYPMQFSGLSWRKKAAARKFDEMRSLLEDDF